jgi:hypothetical protein
MMVASHAIFSEPSSEAEKDDPIRVVNGPQQSRAAGAPHPLSSGETLLSAANVEHLNVILNLEYVGAQFYSFAASGRGLPAALQTGVGAQGSVVGGRQVAFADPVVSRYASELANDRLLRLTTVRGQYPQAVAAQPAIDLTVSSESPFSKAAQSAGLIPAGAIFDPFSGDEKFLLGAFFMEFLVSAAYRTMIAGSSSDLAQEAVTKNLANAIYHGGLIRAAVSEKAQQDPDLVDACTSLGTYITRLDESGTRIASNTGSDGAGGDLIDAGGRRIPFTRSTEEVVSALYLASSKLPGGFLPQGANGLATSA